MQPTFSDRDRIALIHKASSYEKGDVVSLQTDDVRGFKFLSKRVAAVGGDTIEYKLGVLYVNGERYEYCDDLCEALAIGKPIRSSQFKSTQYTYTLQKDEYFVIGDNYLNSEDSRHFGVVNNNNIKYKFLIIFELPW